MFENILKSFAYIFTILGLLIGTMFLDDPIPAAFKEGLGKKVKSIKLFFKVNVKEKEKVRSRKRRLINGSIRKIIKL